MRTPRCARAPAGTRSARMRRSMIRVPVAEDEERALSAGARIADYRVERLIGAGGMGWVYRVRGVLDDRAAALKLLRRDQLRVDSSLDRMLREASILATVAHPGVPRFHACGV